MIDKTEELLLLAADPSRQMDIAEAFLYEAGEEARPTFDVFQEVVNKGQRIYVPEADELLLDIDNVTQERKFERAAQLWEIVTGGKLWVKRFPSKTVGHSHFSVKHPSFIPITTAQKIVNQVFLGSDSLKEYLSHIRYTLGVTYPIRLFNVPGLV